MLILNDVLYLFIYSGVLILDGMDVRTPLFNCIFQLFLDYHP